MLTTKFLIAVLAMVIPLRATTSYASSALMQAGNPGLTFTSVSFDADQNSYSPTLDMGGGLTFTGAAGLGTLTKTINPGGSWPSGQILKGATTGGAIDITLPAGALAFGASFGGVGSSVASITLSGNSGGSFSYSLSPSSGVPFYIGVSSTSAFSSIRIATDFGFEQLALNNFSYGTAAAAETSEAGTMALLGLGLVTLSVVRRSGKARLRPSAE
jgi:hypothetical protein